MISPSAVMIQKSLFEKIGDFDERLRACEDYDLWLRVTRRYPVGLLNRKLMNRYAGHGDQLSAITPNLDRYRIISLRKQLKENLTGKEREETLSVLKEKCLIMAKGAKKRHSWLRWAYYYILYRLASQ